MKTKLALNILGLTMLAAAQLGAEDRVNDPKSFTWKPELSPSGAVVVRVDLKSQTAVVYRGGTQIGSCLVSTGKPGHETPTGVFHILEKDADHHSATYNNAAMPFSERLTWGGVALHAGSLPGYPSSHGCIHLPYEFSRKLFEVTSVGGTVIISDSAQPQAPSREHRIEFTGGHEGESTLKPHEAPEGPVAVVFSTKGKRVQLIRNGMVIGEGPAHLKLFAEKPEGTYSYICDGWARDEKGVNHPHWHQVSGPEGSAQFQAFSHIQTDTKFKHAIDMLMKPGTTLVLTDEPLNAGKRSAPGFSIMQTAAPKAAKP